VAGNGRRCTERVFLEFHHREPYAIGGEATYANVAPRCRGHNLYEAELAFGPAVPGSPVPVVRKAPLKQVAGIVCGAAGP